jgi:hypothetical protein
VDYTYAENGLFPGWKEGRIVSQHWTMGIGESIGIKIVPGAGIHGSPTFYPRPEVPDARGLRRSFAESAMLGGHAFGGPFGLRGEDGGVEPILLRDAGYRRLHRQLVDWYMDKQELFDGSVNAAPVAVLYSQEAMIGDEKRSRQAFEAMIQFLQQHQVPFRYVLSDRLDELAGVKLLVLPHVLPLSDNQVGQIRAFVACGGKVLATGRTSLYDAQMRQRRDYALADCLGQSFDPDSEVGHQDTAWVNPGNGCILLAGEWGLTFPDGRPVSQIPENRLLRLMRHAVVGTVIPTVSSPVPQVGCASRLLPDGRIAMMLINYGDDVVQGITLEGVDPHVMARMWSWEHAGVSLPVTSALNGGKCVKLPPLGVEAFVTLTMNGRSRE